MFRCSSSSPPKRTQQWALVLRENPAVFSLFSFYTGGIAFHKGGFFVKTSSIPESEEESICWMDILLFFFSPRIHRRSYLDFLLLGGRKTWVARNGRRKRRRGEEFRASKECGPGGILISLPRRKKDAPRRAPLFALLFREIFFRDKSVGFSFCLTQQSLSSDSFYFYDRRRLKKGRETELSLGRACVSYPCPFTQEGEEEELV